MRSKPENDKPVCEVYADGSKAWYLNGKIHREDGPAFEYPDGSKVWYLNGELHREDGPAVEYANGAKVWYLNGEPYTPSAHEVIIYKMKYEFQRTHERRMGLLQKKS